MSPVSNQSSVKVIGSNGQVSLGKQFAGRQVLVEEREPGVWLVRTVTVIPDNERWLHEQTAADDLRRAMDWAQANAPSDQNADAMLERFDDAD